MNSKRAKSAEARDFGTEADRVRAMPCIITGNASVCVHVKSRGASGGRFDIIPLSQKLHDEQHRIGVKSFAAKYELDLRAEADRIALEHPRPLGIRGLADEFAEAWRELDGRVFNTGTYDEWALLGWVRREIERRGFPDLGCSAGECGMERRGAGWSCANGAACGLHVDPGEPGHVELERYHLRMTTGDDGPANDREALAHHIAAKLGGAFAESPHGEHGLAWSLCEEAGWPS